MPALIPQLQAPPRVRVEWLIATARAALAAGTLVAAAMDPEQDARVAAYFLSWYLPYSLALLAMVWTPARFAPGWDLTVHIVDVTFFSLWLLIPETSYSPVFVFYVFIVVCATLRWQIAGTVWTATAAIVASLVVGFYAPQFFDDELEALIRTAKDYGFHVAAHAHGAEGIKRAARAGVTTIEHGTFMDDEAIALMKKHGTWYVPTISAGRFVGEKAKVPGFYPEIVRPKAEKVGRQINETFTKAWRAGVKIAFGTDAGVSPHGDNAKEFVYMVEDGMPPLDAIRAATANAAEVLGKKGVLDSMGVLEVMQFLADTFGVTPGDDEITEANLGSLNAIAAFVGRNRK